MENDIQDDIIEPDQTDEQKDTKDEKPEESDEAKLSRLERQAARLRKKLGLDEEPKQEKKETKKEEKEQVGLDKMDRAILRMEKITNKEEIALVEDWVKNTGKDVEQLLANKYFQAELKELRDELATEDATPQGTKRSNNSSRDSVDYWLKKDELPPADSGLRKEYLKRKREIAAKKNIFADEAVV